MLTIRFYNLDKRDNKINVTSRTLTEVSLSLIDKAYEVVSAKNADEPEVKTYMDIVLSKGTAIPEGFAFRELPSGDVSIWKRQTVSLQDADEWLNSLTTA